MSLPIYQQINVRTIHLDDLKHFLHKEINFKHPIALNLKFLDMDQQRELVGLIENFFVTNNISYKFPYPVYLIMDHEKTITRMPAVKDAKELPKFFSQRDSKMNVKESHLISKNRLLQQEIVNADTENIEHNIEKYSLMHRLVFECEKERTFYSSLLNQLL